MRLTCPNCGAQYQVPDEVIPETGRDVQCSNCGDTWFQPHRDHVKDAASEDEFSDAAGGPSDDWDEVDPPQVPAPPAPAAEDFAAPPPENPEQAQTPSPRNEPAPSARPERREIDPSVASVLREEAEREKRARAGAQVGVETQPDLGLDEEEGDATRARQARERMARMRGFDADADQAHNDDHQDIDPRSRSSLFPDIEEINSSLGPDPASHDGGADPQEAYPEALPRKRGGFGRGFLITVLIALAALGVYAFAAQISELVPALRDVLADYVTWVDGLRVWLDGQVAGLMLWLDTVTGNAPAGTPAETGTSE